MKHIEKDYETLARELVAAERKAKRLRDAIVEKAKQDGAADAFTVMAGRYLIERGVTNPTQRLDKSALLSEHPNLTALLNKYSVRVKGYLRGVTVKIAK